MCESEALEKNMSVGYGNNSYKAISESAVLNAVKPLLKKYKLVIFPVTAEITEHVNIFNGSKGETTRLMSQVVATYKIVDIETGEHEILATVGNGSDPQDKGSGKAWTYAYKALLQKTFMLFSGEDTDNTHSDDIYKTESPQNTKGKNQKQEIPTKATIKTKYELLGWKVDDFEAWFSEQQSKFNINQIDGWLTRQINEKRGA